MQEFEDFNHRYDYLVDRYDHNWLNDNDHARAWLWLKFRPVLRTPYPGRPSDGATN